MSGRTRPAGGSHRRRAGARWAVLAFLALLLPAAPRATLLEPLTLDQLAGHADVVLLGRVETVQTEGHGPRRMPVTRAHVLVLEVLAGDLPPVRRVLVTQPGGRADGIELDYAGRPRFVAGREVVLFLQRRAAGQFIIVGLAQGKFDVAAADDAGRRPVFRDLHGAAFSHPPQESLPADLDDLRRRLRARPRDLAGGGE